MMMMIMIFIIIILSMNVNYVLPSITLRLAVQTALPNEFVAKHLYVSAWSAVTFNICHET